MRHGVVHDGGTATTADVVVDGEAIERIEPAGDTGGGPWIDATGCSVLPGFVDVQINGAIGVDLTTEPERIGEVAAFLPRCGVTSFMPTVITSAPARIEAAVATIGAWRHGDGEARSLGIHVEGPFLNAERAGAHPRRHLRPPALDEARRWRADAGVAMVTLAPELPGALDVVAQLRRAGVVVCAGHTDAGPRTLAAAVDAGVRGVTHLFNAMGPMSARRPGAAGAALCNPDVIAGLIVDGLHVDPAMVTLAWRVLGPSRLALVTDAMAALGLGHGTTVIGDTAVTVDERGARTADGVLAGSVLRFDEALRNLVAITGCSLADASTSAAATPARLAGRDDVGRLAPGCAADVVVLDEHLQVVVTVVRGRVAFDPQGRSSWRS